MRGFRVRLRLDHLLSEWYHSNPINSTRRRQWRPAWHRGSCARNVGLVALKARGSALRAASPSKPSEADSARVLADSCYSMTKNSHVNHPVTKVYSLVPSPSRLTPRGGAVRELSQRGSGGYGSPRQMYKATCSDCGKETEVPFKPSQGRPVYCRDCYQKHRRF